MNKAALKKQLDMMTGKLTDMIFERDEALAEVVATKKALADQIEATRTLAQERDEAMACLLEVLDVDAEQEHSNGWKPEQVSRWRKAAGLDTANKADMVGTCGVCRFFLVQDEEWRRKAYPFIGRLSEQIGRHVKLGYCVRRDAHGEGPRSDGDSCRHFDSSNASNERRQEPPERKP